MTTARPLTPDETQSWRLLLRAFTKLTTQLDRELEDEAGLSLADFGVLTALAEGPPDGVRMTQLAVMSLHSKSRLSHCVDRLSSLGLVRRERAEEDRRGLRAVLTNEGARVLRACEPRHGDSVRTYLFEHASDEDLATMSALWTKVIDVVEQAPAPALRRVDEHLVASHA